MAHFEYRSQYIIFYREYDSFCFGNQYRQEAWEADIETSDPSTLKSHVLVYDRTSTRLHTILPFDFRIAQPLENTSSEFVDVAYFRVDGKIYNIGGNNLPM